MYLSPLFLATDQVSHLLVIEFLSAGPAGRLRPPCNLRRPGFPVDSTLKRGLLASCRDRCYSPRIYPGSHLFVLRIPLPGLLTNAEGIGQSFYENLNLGVKCFTCSVVELCEQCFQMQPTGVFFVVVVAVLTWFCSMSSKKPHTMCFRTQIAYPRWEETHMLLSE